MNDRPVLFIVGATASGKTSAALSLALRMSVEIINADSRQVYRGMSIGTAKPTPQEMKITPHHLVDVVDPHERYSLAEFLQDARAAIAGVQGRGALPVVVGGTGQYVWGLAEGWQVPRVPPQGDVRARLQREAAEQGAEVLHARLSGVDPAAAAMIDPRNVRRVIRGLEVWETTGVPFSTLRRSRRPSFRPLLFGLRVDREELHRRIDERLRDTIQRGWIEEVRALLARGYSSELPSFSSTGYREIAAHLAGDLSLEAAVVKARSATNRLVRMQGTWFRADDPRITWAADQEALLSAIEERLQHPHDVPGP